jgi:hypothetical protein
MPQLELGITPLTVELKMGLKVAFFVRKEVHIGVVKLFKGSGVVIEGITLPGMYNRTPDRLFEVHKDMSLESWEI